MEQDANTVLMLHSDDLEQKFQDKRFIKLFVRKNRDGRLGKINYTFYGDYVKFVEIEWDETMSRFEEVVQEDLSITKPRLKEEIDYDMPF